MVFFTCNACGQSVKKAQVEKHYSTQCRQCEVLSCIDCGKDFYGDAYKQHTQCISENEKYGGKGYKAPQKPNKGEAKQAQWLERVRESCSAGNVNSHIKNLLERIAEYPNIPRKKAKFENFVKNSVKVHNPKVMEQIWNVFSSATGKQDKSSGSEEKSNKDTTAKPPCPVQKTQAAETDKQTRPSVESVKDDSKEVSLPSLADGNGTMEENPKTKQDSNVKDDDSKCPDSPEQVALNGVASEQARTQLSNNLTDMDVVTDSTKKRKHKKEKSNPNKESCSSDERVLKSGSGREEMSKEHLSDNLSGTADVTDSSGKVKLRKKAVKQGEKLDIDVSDTVPKGKKKRKEKHKQNDTENLTVSETAKRETSEGSNENVQTGNTIAHGQMGDGEDKEHKAKSLTSSASTHVVEGNKDDKKKKLKRKKADVEGKGESSALSSSDVSHTSSPEKKRKNRHKIELCNNDTEVSSEQEKVSTTGSGKIVNKKVKKLKEKAADQNKTKENTDITGKQQKDGEKHSSDLNSVYTPNLENGQNEKSRTNVAKKKVKKGVSLDNVSPDNKKDKVKKKKTKVSEDINMSPVKTKKKKRKHDEIVIDGSTHELVTKTLGDGREPAKKKVKKSTKVISKKMGVTTGIKQSSSAKVKTKKQKQKSSPSGMSMTSGEIIGEKQTTEGNGDSRLAVSKVSKKKKLKDVTKENRDEAKTKKKKKVKSTVSDDHSKVKKKKFVKDVSSQTDISILTTETVSKKQIVEWDGVSSLVDKNISKKSKPEMSHLNKEIPGDATEKEKKKKKKRKANPSEVKEVKLSKKTKSKTSKGESKSKKIKKNSPLANTNSLDNNMKPNAGNGMALKSSDSTGTDKRKKKKRADKKTDVENSTVH